MTSWQALHLVRKQFGPTAGIGAWIDNHPTGERIHLRVDAGEATTAVKKIETLQLPFLVVIEERQPTGPLG